MLKRRSRIGDGEYVWGVQAAKILGISRSVFYVRFKDNKYPKIDAIKTMAGVKYQLRDVVSTAFPHTSEKKIDEIIISYRKTGFYNLKKRKKRGRK